MEGTSEVSEVPVEEENVEVWVSSFQTLVSTLVLQEGPAANGSFSKRKGNMYDNLFRRYFDCGLRQLLFHIKQLENLGFHREDMSLTKDSFIKLSDGNQIPVLGLGTMCSQKGTKAQARAAAKAAIEAGYRHIDSAFVYENEVELGEVIREKIADNTVKRKDIFYTSKLWSTYHSPELVKQCLDKSLKALKLEYIDLYLIHMPIGLKVGEEPFPKDDKGKWIYQQFDLREIWAAMEACKDAGLVKSIGVSNFNRRQLEFILHKPGIKHQPVCNQVECHVYLNQNKLLEYCKSKGIALVGYSTLGSSRDEQWTDPKSPVLLQDPVLKKIGDKYKKSPAQVALRYNLQRGIVVLAKSFNPEHVKQNIQVFDFQLTTEDMKALDGLNKNLRYIDLKLYYFQVKKNLECRILALPVLPDLARNTIHLNQELHFLHMSVNIWLFTALE
ncbi:estradiol 17 beta-dehydrogenase 5-like [Lissotriton helveticus]